MEKPGSTFADIAYDEGAEYFLSGEFFGVIQSEIDREMESNALGLPIDIDHITENQSDSAKTLAQALTRGEPGEMQAAGFAALFGWQTVWRIYGTETNIVLPEVFDRLAEGELTGDEFRDIMRVRSRGYLEKNPCVQLFLDRYIKCFDPENRYRSAVESAFVTMIAGAEQGCAKVKSRRDEIEMLEMMYQM